MVNPKLPFLDPGEKSLWAHAITRNDAWMMCGPDKASLLTGVRLGFRNRLVALEKLLWLAQTLSEIVILERP